MKKSMGILFLGVVFLCSFMCSCKNDGDKEGFTIRHEEESTGYDNSVSVNVEDMDYNYMETLYYYVTGYDNKVYSCETTGNGEKLLYVADLEEGIQKPLCNKKDCKHKGEKCGAFLAASPNYVKGIKAVNDGIYALIANHTDNSLMLIKIPLNGGEHEDLGYIYKKGICKNVGVSGHYMQMADGYVYYILSEELTEDVPNLDDNGNPTGGFTSVPIEKKLFIYRYKLDGSQKAEIILNEDVSEDGYSFTYSIYDGYLYYYNGGCKRIQLDTGLVEAVGENEHYITGYNNVGKTLAYAEAGEEFIYYMYDQVKDTKALLEESGLDEGKIQILKSFRIGGTKVFYADDKYIYLCEPFDGITFVFDLDFKYVDYMDYRVYGTIGNNIISVEDEYLVAISRDKMFDNNPDKYKLIKRKGTAKNEWLTEITG
ncbi:MAG: hypothetical protein E7266_07290 [Lachnospiraceae bacterium]|nr:hypothetical protein [Lachnospiraceae bacterium]